MSQHRLQDFARTAYTAAAGHLEIDAEPTEPRPHRWLLTPRAALAVVFAVVVLASGLALRVWLTAAAPEALPAPVPAATVEAEVGDVAAASSGSDGATGAPPGDAGAGEREEESNAPQVLVVHVAGQVATPGVVELAPGARVTDAVDAAGGALPGAELGAVNLARALTDGEQVYVPAVGEAVPAAAGGATPAPEGGTAATGAGGRVNLNTAAVAELDTLPGIGPALAQRIVDWRTANGSFTAVDELDAVSGIGPATVAELRDLVTV